MVKSRKSYGTFDKSRQFDLYIMGGTASNVSACIAAKLSAFSKTWNQYKQFSSLGKSRNYVWKYVDKTTHKNVRLGSLQQVVSRKVLLPGDKMSRITLLSWKKLLQKVQKTAVLGPLGIMILKEKIILTKHSQIKEDLTRLWDR